MQPLITSNSLRDKMAKAKRSKQQNQAQSGGSRTIATNRRARYNYHLLDQYDAGLQLTGSEIKSIRAGQVNLRDGYVSIQKGEAWLQNVHIATYTAASRENHEETRSRKLLLKRREILKLEGLVTSKGLTIVPVRLYISEKGLAKVVIALARGKQLYDKRNAIADREARRNMERARKQTIYEA